MPKGKELPHLRVRIEPKLLARLEKAREKSGRTLTGEIVSRIEQSFRREDHEELIAATVDRTLAALKGLGALAGPPTPPAPPSYGGILGPLTKPQQRPAEAESTTAKQEGDKS
jgi:hypothetical protein